MIYLALVLFLGFLFVLKGRYHLVDLYLLYCVYFDISVRFAGNQATNYAYLQYALVLAYAALYVARFWSSFRGLSSRLLFLVFVLFSLIIFMPIMRGVGIDPVLRNFAVHLASLVILPIAFHHYTKEGKTRNLLRIIGLTTILWASAVIVFSLLNIDATILHLGSESFGLGFVYFGQMSVRGAISYIALFLIAYPLVQKETDCESVYMVIKDFIPYLNKYPKMLGYKKQYTKTYYKKGSIKANLSLLLRKISGQGG